MPRTICHVFEIERQLADVLDGDFEVHAVRQLRLGQCLHLPMSVVQRINGTGKDPTAAALRRGRLRTGRNPVALPRHEFLPRLRSVRFSSLQCFVVSQYDLRTMLQPANFGKQFENSAAVSNSSSDRERVPFS